jgi:adenosylcobinamide kinase/adenosylcobinamide-phosphate guanylyltransferase
MNSTLILGGARSGKSRFAERLAKQLSKNPVYLATSRRWDDDHAARIERHRRDRGPEWTNLEEELALCRVDMSGRVIVVDCITLWLTNFFVDESCDIDAALTRAKSEMDRFLALNNTLFFVSNEVGQGLHAPTESGRKFTDLQGFFNQFLAERVDNVALMVAGLPLLLKGSLSPQETSA